ncbi:MAG: transposase, partial [Candidatus Hydrogenedentes bacterium]|nr:transposase [Candidatus Hydrogenedentota bacterium]
MSARRINEVRKSPGKAVWQRSFYDRVIRDENEWRNMFGYIEGNPAQWAADRENPSVKIRKGDKKYPWL